jgi:hypothetical protein
VKKLSTVFNFIGFTIQYIVPILLFGNVIPYTHDGIKAGLTGVGYIALAVLLFFSSKKLKEWILQQKKSVWRGLVLSIFPIVWWLIIFLCLGWLSRFLLTFTQYWDKVIIFIIIGRIFYVVSETISEGGVTSE